MNPCVTHKIAQINLGPFDRLYFDLRSSQRFPDSNFFSNLVNVFRDFKTLKKKGGGGGEFGGKPWDELKLAPIQDKFLDFLKSQFFSF